MSGEKYNYIHYWVEEGALELLERQADVQAMYERLRELGYAQLAAKETESVLVDLKQLKQSITQIEQTIAQLELELVPLKTRIETRGRNLSDVWKAVEWWDSRDESEQKVLEAISQLEASE